MQYLSFLFLRCDRILSFGKGIRLLRYGRSELKFSDHRPVSATYMVEVEVFSPRKLQRALTFTDAEIAKEEIVTNMGLENGMSRFISDQVCFPIIRMNFQKHESFWCIHFRQISSLKQIEGQ